MDTQAELHGIEPSTKPLIYAGPDDRHIGSENMNVILEAIERSGGTISESPEEAEAIVWLSLDSARLSDILSPKVRWVQLPSAGVETWVQSDIIDHRRVFTSARGAYSQAVAEHALALMLAGTRRLHHYARATEWDSSGVTTDGFFSGSKVVIVGCGGIGEALIRMLEPFRAEVIAVTHSGRNVPGASANLPASETARSWPEGDFFVLAAPATESTTKMIGAQQLAAMRDHAWIVNVSRGSLIDTDALVESLASERIGGAALDVTDPEPLPAGHPLWGEPRALITPHSANPRSAFISGLIDRIQDNVARFVADEPLVGVVDVELGY